MISRIIRVHQQAESMPTVNHYFDGKVSSIGFATDTLPATIGVMEPGEYAFNTTHHEVILILSGALSVKLPNQDEWKTFGKKEWFCVDANTYFQVSVKSDTAYMCTYE